MIAWIKGAMRHRASERVVVDVGGVGYELTVPIGVGGQTDLGEVLELHVHTHVREDQISLFGFDDVVQVETFRTLMNVKGVGPRLAVAIIGGLDPQELVTAVETNDVGRLQALKGVGKRLAERMCTELRGKLEFIGVAPSGLTRAKPALAARFADLSSALKNLGYRPKEIDAVVGQLAEEQPDTDFDGLVRSALSILRK